MSLFDRYIPTLNHSILNSKLELQATVWPTNVQTAVYRFIRLRPEHSLGSKVEYILTTFAILRYEVGSKAIGCLMNQNTWPRMVQKHQKQTISDILENSQFLIVSDKLFHCKTDIFWSFGKLTILKFKKTDIFWKTDIYWENWYYLENWHFYI